MESHLVTNHLQDSQKFQRTQVAWYTSRKIVVAQSPARKQLLRGAAQNIHSSNSWDSAHGIYLDKEVAVKDSLMTTYRFLSLVRLVMILEGINPRRFLPDRFLAQKHGRHEVNIISTTKQELQHLDC